jgi:hypothetical protein
LGIALGEVDDAMRDVAAEMAGASWRPFALVMAAALASFFSAV